jgi:glycine cleavage system H protein
MENIFYTKEHYWISIEDNVATVGFTDFVLNNMNVVNYADLPQLGMVCSRTELLGEINYNDDEIFEIYSVFSGEITDVNDSIIDNCEQLMSGEDESNWLYKIYVNSKNELEEELLSKKEYEEYLEEL